MLSYFRILRHFIFVAVLALSLLFNFMLLVSTSVFNVASALVGGILSTDLPPLRSSDEFARLTADLDEQKRLNRRVHTEMSEMGAELATARATRKQVNETVERVAARVVTRTTKAATRETAAMAGEAIPFWGVAVIVAATTLELSDFCQTIVDMNELETILDPSRAVARKDLTVCGMSVPSRKALWESASSAPGAAWASARGVMPTMDDISNFEIPDIEWKKMAASVGATVSAFGQETKDVARRKIGEIKNWWNN